MKQILTVGFVIFVFSFSLLAQKVENESIKRMIENYKTDERGPYKDIRWFCKDGTFALPKEKCREPGGVQRARYKDEVIALANSNHIFLGQILSKTLHEDFWDADNYNSRLKQYQLEKYLRAIDEGWILRKAQYYRGAYQIEDEEAWGIEFFNWLLAEEEPLINQFYLTRQAVKDISHRGDDNKTLSVRSVSKAISDAYAPFMNLRVKIHGQPEYADIAKVQKFQKTHQAKLTPELNKKFEMLISDMKEVYQPAQLVLLKRYVNDIPKDADIRTSLENYISLFKNDKGGIPRIMATAEELAKIRAEIITVKSRKGRLALLDLSNALEEIFFAEISQWQPKNLKESTEKICYSGLAALGTGLIEEWEWSEVVGVLCGSQKEEVTLAEIQLFLDRSRSLLEWGTGMVHGVYKDVVNLYNGFEPQANGFFDDRIRSSVLLSLGNSIGQLGNFIRKKANLSNKVLTIPNQSSIRGLNPGLAFGELVVVGDNMEDVEISKDKIYVFRYPPYDLKPVAGILTVSEGNMVSHVQLLARNLGIPNAVLSAENRSWLKRFSGKKVFYAVSNRGTVSMKTAEKMTEEEKALFAKKERSEARISVPIEKIDLNQKSVLNMREVNAASSGKICGPKAANLGQLKMMFPENVVEGIILPFGIFRQHMDQKMPTQNGTYWDFLNDVFQKANEMRNNGSSEEAVENYSLEQLTILREAIKKIELLPEFVKDLDISFENVFEKKIGEVPVFLRSDTNMEDLKDFTGAGLNLTVFNVLDRAKIIQGIKDVWASPYTERSFKWRQRYLLNPENVYPSILIIPSVDVEYSGVLITKGIPTADGRDITIAFSRGAGGAVDGQAAESYLLYHSGENRLLSPAREPMYRRLPESGGSKMLSTTFHKPILNAQNKYDLRWLAYNIHQEIPKATTADNNGPFDVELGFKEDKIWLFQIRPFVENKNALNSNYLEKISPKVDGNKKVRVSEEL